ncbi:MAG: SCO family protein [Chloroflexales bacterium]
MIRVRSTLVLLVLALLLSACASAPAAAPTAANTETDVPTAGTLIDPPKPLSDFTLPSSAGGKPLSLSDLRGKPVLLYFGYTFCPDICPTTLSEFIRVKHDLASKGDQLAVLMVSVDPERDTPEVLGRYMQAFDPSFIGMTSNEATLRRIGSEYGLFYQRHAVSGSAAAYLMDHSAATYLIDQQGQLRMVYSYGTPHTVIAPDVERLLAEKR